MLAAAAAIATAVARAPMPRELPSHAARAWAGQRCTHEGDQGRAHPGALPHDVRERAAPPVPLPRHAVGPAVLPRFSAVHGIPAHGSLQAVRVQSLDQREHHDFLYTFEFGRWYVSPTV